MAPIIWFSKKQNTVESSTFGAELIALKIATELIESLRYKLRMMGVPLAGPARVMCDNQSVVISSSFPESTLKKKHCSIAFHRVREVVAAGKLLIYYERTGSNIADLFTKVLTANKRFPLVQSVLSWDKLYNQCGLMWPWIQHDIYFEESVKILSYIAILRGW